VKTNTFAGKSGRVRGSNKPIRTIGEIKMKLYRIDEEEK